MTGPRAIPFWSPAEIDSAIADTIAHLDANGVLGYPTETVYGFGGAVDHESVDALVRQRPVADEVAETEERIDPLAVQDVEHCVERMEIRVDVGNDAVAHPGGP